MHTFEFEFPGDRPAQQRAHVGVVGSGDLEILVSPSADGAAVVQVRTSVDGFDDVWRNVLERFFTRYGLTGAIQINDFGATPGVVSIRLLQALDQSTTAETGRN
ncbi:malonate decarboxylase acyl carrier protein [Subtercola boreus]|uniref:Malonate decarboxylase acyl carrier protein n=1 Tax=Subtercola boreus TaxID=120213 RepID=A0A3E0VEP2_9MICO|nr:malonate decarboxylase subunit delta [Subtercola boreus]RFA08115.1 malonate decarboxylase acyl carrier protein [Subtercola boreus]TQL54997.1 malonate decarboxylase delta subunit [Subtercola boreus]